MTSLVRSSRAFVRQSSRFQLPTSRLSAVNPKPRPSHDHKVKEMSAMSYHPKDAASVNAKDVLRATLPPDTPVSAGLSAASTDSYLESKLTHPEYAGDTSLQRGQERAQEAGMPQIAVSAMQGQMLSVIAKSMGAEKILEIGALAGYSTSFLAKGLPPHGQIDTIEFSPKHAQVAQANFLDTDLWPFPKVHVGAALDLLRDPNGAFAVLPGTEEGLPVDKRGYDLIFIDADKENYYEYFIESLRLVRKGGMIILDNAVRGGRIALEFNDEPELNVVGLRKLYDWVEKDNGKTVLMTCIQTVGSKSWDGFAMAVKL